MTYTELKAKHSKEFGELEGIFWAFSDKQFHEGMEKIGLEPGQLDKIMRLPGGGFILKAQEWAFDALFERHTAEREAFLAEPENLYKALVYELNNHEYGYTHDESDALCALGFEPDEIAADILQRAKSFVLSQDY